VQSYEQRISAYAGNAGAPGSGDHADRKPHAGSDAFDRQHACALYRYGGTGRRCVNGIISLRTITAVFS
jgi:hypothetical protein